MKKNLWILAAVGAMALPQIGMAQPGPQPGQPPQPKPAVQPAKPQPAPAVKPFQPAKPQPAKPQPAKPAMQPQKPQPAPAVKPQQHQPAPKPQPPVVVKPQQPQPAPKPQPAPAVKPQPPQPPHVTKPEPPKPQPPVEYRPGHKNHPLQPPKERDHYKDWAPLHHKHFYGIAEAPERLQVSMRVGQEVELKLEERIGDGLKWFARHNPTIVDVDVEHERPRWYKFGSKAHSEVEIEARRPGNTMVELVYARPNEWDRGDAPQKVVQIFVHIE